jgi:predicted nucleotidyltransferase
LTHPADNFRSLLEALNDAQVRFIVIGGVAGIAHGAARVTLDLDIVYARDDRNLESLASALRPFSPYLRGAPAGLPFVLDAETLRRGLNFTLITDRGDIDLLGEIAGGGGYAELAAHATAIELLGQAVLVLNLRKLIEVKRAAGRPKDFEAIAELELLLAEQEGNSD